MATTATATTRTNGQRAPERARSATGVARRSGRRRQLPLVVIGVLLVLGCALAFTDASLHLGSREEVLVVTQPLAAGQVLTPSDLRAAQVSTGSGLQRRPGRRKSRACSAGAWRSRWWPGPCSPPPRLAPPRRSPRAPTWWRSASRPAPTRRTWRRATVCRWCRSSRHLTPAAAPALTSGSPVAATVLAVEPASADSGSPTVFSLQVSKG